MTFADAVRLLGEADVSFLSTLDDRSGANTGAVDLRSVRDQVVEWGRGAVRRLGERPDQGRYERTQSVVATHGVVVVAAFFEALDDLGTIPTAEPGTLHMLGRNVVPVPSPAAPETLREDLEDYYRSLARCVTNQREDEYRLVSAAIDRYRIGYRALAAEVPEIAIWAADSRREPGPVNVELTTGLRGVRALLERLTEGIAIRRSDLVARYRSDLERPIVDVGALPSGVEMPTTAALYINPRVRLRRAGWSAPVATESWWAEAVTVDDIQPFLARYLTGLEAVTTPLVVLGQPGSGKSMLSRVLAANLPTEDFLPVRVDLRSVAADAPLQDQIEEAVYQAIGERVAWPELVRSAGGALPVVMLDGFDELLQASSVNRANYLEQIREFQRREADLGRPVAVLVTSRIVVADRSRVPEGSTVLRLDPFDRPRIERWLAVWRVTNLAGLAAGGLVPLAAEVALRYREMAEQPLLLLMLALYDAWDNALRRAPAGMDRAELYERLFADFARREIGKRESVLPSDRMAVAITREIWRLELVAMAIFARAAQIVTEESLDSDLRQLLRDEVPGRKPDRPLTAAQLLVGRFFFLHESRARDGIDAPERSFEFLHATFGEFLVARLVVGTLVDLAEEQARQASRPYPAAGDAGPLYAWLSFSVLARRTPIVEFCGALMARLSQPAAARCRTLLIDLLRNAAFPLSTWSLGGYEPVRRSAAERHAAFTANLVTLIVLLGPGVEVSELFQPSDSSTWRSHALLWESQLPEDGWRSLWQTVRLTYRVPREHSDDNRLEYRTVPWLALDDGTPVNLHGSMPLIPRTVPPDQTDRPFQDFAVAPNSSVGSWLREAAFRQDHGTLRAVAHSMVPFWRYVTSEIGEIADAYPPGTDAAALLEVLLAPRDSDAADQRRLISAYLTCLEWMRDVGRARLLIMRTLEDDVDRIDAVGVVDVVVQAARAPARAAGLDRMRQKTALARILALLHLRNADPRQLRRAYQSLTGGGFAPEEERFDHILRQEFIRLGAEFPEELFR